MLASTTRVLALSVACCCLTSCVNLSCTSFIVHNPKAAQKEATRFAQTAFVARDYATAHSLLSPAARQHIPKDKLSETIAAMHPKAFPSRVTATEYESVPGQRGMIIYLGGDGEDEDFYYRLLMEGDAPSGYRVSGLYRGNGPHPSTNKRPLKP